MLHSWDGIGKVENCVWFPPNTMSEIHTERVQSLSYQIRKCCFWKYFRYILVSWLRGCHVLFIKKQFVSDRSTIHTWLVDSFGEMLELWHRDFRLLGHLWPRHFSPDCSVFRLPASSRKNPCESKLLPFKDDEGHKPLWDLENSKKLSAPFFAFGSWDSPYSEFCRRIHWPNGCFDLHSELWVVPWQLGQFVPF